MNPPFVLAQANGPVSPRTVSITKPAAGAAVSVRLDGTSRLDLSAITAEQITLVRVGDQLVILFDNQATVTIAPFFDASGQPLPDLALQLGPDRTVGALEFATLFPITDDPAILPAAGEGARNTGGPFGTFSIEALSGRNGLDLLNGETLGGVAFGTAPPPNDFPQASDLTLALDDDAINVSEGNAGGPGDESGPATVSGILPVVFGRDGAGGVFFAPVSAPAGLTSGGETVSFALSADGRTITAATASGVVFTVTLTLNADASVGYTVTLFRPLDHPGHDDPATVALERAFEDNIALAFPITVLDQNGDSVTASLVLDIDDDSPVINLANVENRTVDEEGLRGGNPGDSYASGDAPGEVLSVTGALGISWGADRGNAVANGGVSGAPVNGDRAVVFSSAGDRLLTLAEAAAIISVIGSGGPLDLSLLTSGASPLAFTLSGNGTVLTASTGQGAPVFTVTLSDVGNAGSYGFVLQAPIQHPGLDREDDLAFAFRYTAIDSDGDAVDGAFTVTVKDDAPVGGADAFSGFEDTLLAGSVGGNDSPGADGPSPLLYRLLSGPAHGQLSFDLLNGSFTYTPDLNFNGADGFTYSLVDRDGDVSAPVTVSLDIAAVNDAPEIHAPVSIVTDEDVPYVFNSTILFADVDAGNAQLRVTVNFTNGVLTFPSTGGTYFAGIPLSIDGTLAQLNTLFADLTYTPDPNYFGSATIALTIDDFGNTGIGGALTDSWTVNILINPVNDLPVAGDNTFTVAEDTPLVSLASVLADDTDVENDPLTAVLVSGPAHAASFTLNADGTFSYTPAANFFGTDSFTYRAFDGTAESNIATVAITVTPVNDAPAAGDDAFDTDEDTTLAPAVSVLADDTDVDNDPLTAVLLSSPTHAASFTFNPDGTFVYTPVANFFGTDSFTYQASDGQDVSNVAVVTITVRPQNDPPVGVDDTYDVGEDTQLRVSPFAGVARNDTDADNDVIHVTLVSGPTHAASFTLGEFGDFTYVPQANYTGPDSFTYRPRDASAEGNLTTVTITVTPVNDAPVITSDGGGSIGHPAVRENTTFVTTVVATDVDGDSVTYAITGGRDAGQFSIDPLTGILSFVSAPDFENPTDGGRNNIYEVVVQASDGPLTDEQTLLVEVQDLPEINARNDSFGATIDAFSVSSGNAQRFLNLGNGQLGAPATLSQSNGQHVVLGDVDRDGDLDAVTAQYGASSPRLWLNNGAGTFTAAGSQPQAIYNNFAIALGDIDRDGDLDIFAPSYQQFYTIIYKNNGAGVFAYDGNQGTGYLFSSSGPAATDVELGDLDGDGDLDAFVTNFNASSQIWRNNGSGNFGTTSSSGPFGKWKDVDLVDIDRDGDLDAILSGGDNNPNSSTAVYRNNGAGAFSLAATLLPPPGSGGNGAVTQATAIGDLNGDGFLDIYQANLGFGGDRVWLGDGTGGFTLRETVADSVGTDDVQLADFDGDGDLDAFLAAFNNAGPTQFGFDRILLNDGTGHFALGQEFTTRSWGIGLGNLDTPGRAANQVHQLAVLANDTADPGVTFSISGVGVSALGALVTIDPGGQTLSYDGRTVAALLALAPGQTLTDTFTYTVSDGGSASDTATVSIVLAGVNDAPTDIVWNGAVPSLGFRLPFDGETIATLSAIDPDNASGFTYSLLAGSSSGFNLSAGGTITRGGDMPTNGSFTLNIQVTDASGASFSETFNVITGNSQGNTLPTGGAGAAVLAGDDVLYGSDGGDTLFGGAGNDTLFGMDGADALIGGLGNDALRGGGSADTFRWLSGDLPGLDRILDFATGTSGDIIDLAGLLAGVSGNKADHVRFEDVNGLTRLASAGGASALADGNLTLQVDLGSGWTNVATLVDAGNNFTAGNETIRMLLDTAQQNVTV